jgi:hypothetical protein
MNPLYLTDVEHAALLKLEAVGPSRTLNFKTHGRLALYRMIDEGPNGWAITAVGRAMLRARRVVTQPLAESPFTLPTVLATAQNTPWLETD